ncbi:DNA helicase [Ranunculus cassubicifolius]
MYAEFHVPALGNTQTFTPIRNLSPQLNSINFSGLPSHKLIIKEGCPIILTRNINPRARLCNGTRLICNNFYCNVITVEIVSGSCKGQTVFIPRISQKPSSDMELPFLLRRKQFPIRLLG